MKHYVRYMDDFCIFSNSKDELVKCLDFIKTYLKSIGLELNKKTTIQPIYRNMKFMNWKFTVTETGKILMIQDRRKVRDKRKKLIKMLNLVMTNKMKPEYFEQSLNGIIAHLEKGNSYTTIKEFKNYIKIVPCGTIKNNICSTWNIIKLK